MADSQTTFELRQDRRSAVLMEPDDTTTGADLVADLARTQRGRDLLAHALDMVRDDGSDGMTLWADCVAETAGRDPLEPDDSPDELGTVESADVWGTGEGRSHGVLA